MDLLAYFSSGVNRNTSSSVRTLMISGTGIESYLGTQTG